MDDNIFSFKIIVHNIQLSHIIFNNSYLQIEEPIVGVQFLDYPVLKVRSRGPINIKNIDEQHFGSGSSTCFKLSINELKQKLEKQKLILLLCDCNGHMNKLIAKSLVSLVQFSDILNQFQADEKESFKRQYFMMQDAAKNIVGRADISISILMRYKSYLQKQINKSIQGGMALTFGNKFNKKNEDSFQQTPDVPLPKSSQKISKTVAINPQTTQQSLKSFQNQRTLDRNHNDLQQQQKIFQSFQLNDPKQKISLKADKQDKKNANIIQNIIIQQNQDQQFEYKEKNLKIIQSQPSIYKQAQESFAPPTMFFKNISQDQKKPIIVDNFIQQDYKFQENIIQSQLKNQIIQDQSNTITMINQLLNELVLVRSNLQNGTIPNTAESNTLQQIHNSNQQLINLNNNITKNNNINYASPQKSTKNESIEKKTPSLPKNNQSDTYSDDFENQSFTHTQTLSNNQQQTENKSSQLYENEGFESFSVSQSKPTQNMKNSEIQTNISGSFVNSQNQKLIQCFICHEKFEAQKAAEHARQCKKEFKKQSHQYQQKSTSQLDSVSYSIESIEEEDEQQSKKFNTRYNNDKDKSSFSKNKSDVYSEDFEVVSEEEFTDSY